MAKNLIITVFTLFLIGGLTIGIIVYGRGYRLNFDNGKIKSTGLLLVKSYPDGAEVYLNGHLTSATNNTLSLPPAEYEVKITKDGYFPWEKKIIVKGEVVARAEALLLPVAPELRPLTLTGALNPVMSLDGNKIAYGIATASAEKQGIWINDLVDKALTFQPAARQIFKDTQYLKLSEAEYVWSPDGKEILALSDDNFFLLDTGILNAPPRDITLTSDIVISKWNEDHNLKKEALVKTLKPVLFKFLKNNAKLISWAPDETKFLYEATTSALLSPIIIPKLIGANSQPEERNIQKGKIYVYDIKEDKNFFIKENEPSSIETDDRNLLIDYIKETKQYDLLWLSDSNHLIWINKKEENNKKIEVSEYDNTNKAIVFAAPFVDNFIFPFPNSTRFIILTTLNPQITIPNLYIVNLR